MSEQKQKPEDLMEKTEVGANQAPAGLSQGPAADTAAKTAPRGARAGAGAGARGGKGGGRGAGGRGGKPRERIKSEYEQKSIDVRRVTRVVSGGRRFNFSVAMIIGDRKGKVGVGLGKAADISQAMDKASKNAKKNLITVKRTKTNSIAHEIACKYASADIVIFPAPGRGLVAGSAVRNVLELAGVTDITSKILSGSKNRLNMARATVQALKTLG